LMPPDASTVCASSGARFPSMRTSAPDCVAAIAARWPAAPVPTTRTFDVSVRCTPNEPNGSAGCLELGTVRTIAAHESDRRCLWARIGAKRPVSEQLSPRSRQWPALWRADLECVVSHQSWFKAGPRFRHPATFGVAAAPSSSLDEITAQSSAFTMTIFAGGGYSA
jgi:hypothetical protein